MMDYSEHLVPLALQRHVQCGWRLRDPAPTAAPHTVYPDGRCELIVHLAQPMEIQTADGWQAQSRLLFAAQSRRAIRLRAIGPIDCVGLRLRPEASATWMPDAIAAEPIRTWVDRVLDLRTLDPPFALALLRSLDPGAEDTTHHAFMQVLTQRLAPRPIDAHVAAAVATIDAAHGNLSVRALAKTIGASVRSLQMRFVAAVGLTLKEYALVQRLQATIRQFDDPGNAPLAQTAVQVGFADQAHATRALRAFAGLTPARLRQALRAQRDGDQTLAMAAAFVRGDSVTR